MIVAKNKSNDIRVNFNDVCIRELHLGVTEDEFVYNQDTDELLCIKEKFLKYPEDEYYMFKHNEIDFNLIENYRLMETLLYVYLRNYAKRKNITIHSITQSNVAGSKKCGITEVYYLENNEIKKIQSEPFENESVRMFNLLCKINHTTHLYNFDEFDVIIDRSKR